MPDLVVENRRLLDRLGDLSEQIDQARSELRAENGETLVAAVRRVVGERDMARAGAEGLQRQIEVVRAALGSDAGAESLVDAVRRVAGARGALSKPERVEVGQWWTYERPDAPKQTPFRIIAPECAESMLTDPDAYYLGDGEQPIGSRTASSKPSSVRAGQLWRVTRYSAPSMEVRYFNHRGQAELYDETPGCAPFLADPIEMLTSDEWTYLGESARPRLGPAQRWLDAKGRGILVQEREGPRWAGDAHLDLAVVMSFGQRVLARTGDAAPSDWTLVSEVPTAHAGAESEEAKMGESKASGCGYCGDAACSETPSGDQSTDAQRRIAAAKALREASAPHGGILAIQRNAYRQGLDAGERLAAERAHADGIVEGLERARGILWDLDREGVDPDRWREMLEERIEREKRDVAPVDRRPSVDQAALLELATGWEGDADGFDEVRQDERARIKAGKTSRFMLGFLTAGGTVHRTCADDLRRLLDAPRGPGGGESDPAAAAEVDRLRAELTATVEALARREEDIEAMAQSKKSLILAIYKAAGVEPSQSLAIVPDIRKAVADTVAHVKRLEEQVRTLRANAIDDQAIAYRRGQEEMRERAAIDVEAPLARFVTTRELADRVRSLPIANAPNASANTADADVRVSAVELASLRRLRDMADRCWVSLGEKRERLYDGELDRAVRDLVASVESNAPAVSGGGTGEVDPVGREAETAGAGESVARGGDASTHATCNEPNEETAIDYGSSTWTPLCTESAGHSGDHVARKPDGSEVTRWARTCGKPDVVCEVRRSAQPESDAAGEIERLRAETSKLMAQRAEAIDRATDLRKKLESTRAEIAQWQQATAMYTAEGASRVMHHMREENEAWCGRYNSVVSEVASQADQLAAWRTATGCDSPDAAKQRIDQLVADLALARENRAHFAEVASERRDEVAALRSKMEEDMATILADFSLRQRAVPRRD